MALPFSRSHVERLGDRLIATSEPADADIAELHRLLEAYDEVLTTALTRVREALHVAPTSRVKNTGTILEKLHRQGGSWLKSMHDLAGMRIVGAADRNEQDALVDQLTELFGGEPRAPKVIDRRLSPSHGYRAVHLIVFPDDVAVEIQVRTRWQHEWADMFEKLADRVGRDIRYGAPPERPGERVTLAIEWANSVANYIEGLEAAEVAAPGASELNQYRDDIAGHLKSLRSSLEDLEH